MQKQYLSENKIVSQIEEYIENDKINYAILIDGKWGSGKTYFIKNVIIDKLDIAFKDEQSKLDLKHKAKSIINKDVRNSNKHKKPVYVSLYGVTSVSEIKNKIVLSLIKSEKIKKIIPVLDVGFEVGNDLISKNYSINDSSRKVTRVLSNFYKLENIIIFFDDLERCNLDINSVLGYINQLVEHNKIKVILIADEEKIGKINYENNIELKYLTTLKENIDYEEEPKKDIMDSVINNGNKLTLDEIKNKSSKLFGGNVLYNEIKEKLIGKTIYYRPNIDSIYKVLAEKMIDDESIRKIVLDKKENLVKIIEKYDYWNLRTLQFIFQVYEKLAIVSINSVNLKGHKEKILTELFEYCVLKSLQIKQGQNTYNWEKEKEFGTIYLGNELRDFVYHNYVKGFRFVDDYLIYSFIDEEQVKKIIENYIYLEDIENNNPNDPLYKLQYYWIISEDELIKLLDEMVLKINNNEYPLDLYPKVLQNLVSILNMGIHSEAILKAINQLGNNIKNNNVLGNFDNDRHFMAPSKEVADLYNKYIKEIDDLVISRDEKGNIDIVQNILSKDNWGHELKNYCDKNQGKLTGEKKYAYLLDIDLIVKNIVEKDIENIYEFYYSLQRMYKSSNINEFLSADKPKLKELKKAINKIKKVDKVKQYSLKLIDEYLDEVIKKLDD